MIYDGFGDGSPLGSYPNRRLFVAGLSRRVIRVQLPALSTDTVFMGRRFSPATNTPPRFNSVACQMRRKREKMSKSYYGSTSHITCLFCRFPYLGARLPVGSFSRIFSISSSLYSAIVPIYPQGRILCRLKRMIVACTDISSRLATSLVGIPCNSIPSIISIFSPPIKLNNYDYLKKKTFRNMRIIKNSC